MTVFHAEKKDRYFPLLIRILKMTSSKENHHIAKALKSKALDVNTLSPLNCQSEFKHSQKGRH